MQWADIIWNFYASIRTFAVIVMNWLYSTAYVNLKEIITSFIDLPTWIENLIPNVNFFLGETTTTWYEILFEGSIVTIIMIAIVSFVLRIVAEIIDIFT